MAEVQEACRWCGNLHGPMCPWVKAFEFDIGGNVTRVEFFSSSEFTTRSEVATEAAEPEPDYPKLGQRWAR